MTHPDDRPPTHLRPVVDEPPFDQYDDTPRPPPDRGPRAAPADHGAERAILATLLAEPFLDGHHPGEDLAHELDTDDFYWLEHQLVWDTWHHLHATLGIPPDAVALNSAIVATRNERAIRAVTDIATTRANPLLAATHARTIRDLARLRVVDTLRAGLGDIVDRAKVDQIDLYLGEALQRLDETVIRFGPRTTTADTGIRDLTWVLSGQPPVQPPPVYVQRTDGTALFYKGKVNGVFGDPEHGKTWLAQIAVVEALNAGGTAAMIDVDHNGQDATAARLLLLGAHIHHIADPTRFRYYEPEDAAQLRNAVTDVINMTPDVLLIDSLGEIFPMLGVTSNDGDEVTAAMRTVCTAPANAGSCVITIDHLPKSSEVRATGFAIGSIAKKRMMRGAYIRAEARQQPAPGGIGRITLRIEKDTTGELRKSSGGGYAGTLTIDSTQPHITTWTIGRDETPKNDDGTFRPTGYMEKVATYVAANAECTQNDIEAGIPGTAKHIRQALQVLVTEGHIARAPGPRRSKLHTLVIPYREAEDDHAQPTL